MDLGEIRERFRAAMDQVRGSDDLAVVRGRFLGRRGLLAEARAAVDFASMADVERRDFGREFNALKKFMESLIRTWGQEHRQGLLSDDWIDVTVPAPDHPLGSLHPITLVQMQAEDILERMGFTVLPGLEVESEYYNFDALNIPPEHPARDMQDTYWLTNGEVLRTHTSANQVRVLRARGVPVRAAFPGRCFRRENLDASHENTFYQLEGLYVDAGVSIANLIATMKELLAEVFQAEMIVRLRPGYFPYVEPGFELDIRCVICGGRGCSTCKHSGWVELLPCGMVHPKVLEAGQVDASRYSGFAFGLGLTRLAMMRFGIAEIRLFNSGDLRFLGQFARLTASRRP
jgi:phenylalanyl-tRNA synthetase alpha chain